jgi:hypothetical protein
MLMDLLQTELGWPVFEEIWAPSGSGPRVYAELADRKIGDSLRRFDGGTDIRLGVLVPDSAEQSSQQPLAIVCEYKSPATTSNLREAHRLSWNFSRAPLLVTLEPHLIRAWSCCEPPSAQQPLQGHAAEILQIPLEPSAPKTVLTQAARSLHWLQLVTGNFFRQHEERFNRDGCADRLLLENLKSVRQQLRRQKLSDDTTHDLLARLIFIQFLFDRRDSAGVPALNATKLLALHKDGILGAVHDSLASVLQDYDDAYALFHWLDTIFNGDLFPAKGGSSRQREQEWHREMSEVKPTHLRTIANFVTGKTRMQSGQQLLWQQYSFDAIPLEFISSIYEEFVTKGKAHKTGTVYTPPHVVDLLLDEVLPWDSNNWNIRILDPACGSGIFLVKAFQRLVHRWRLAHPDEEPKASDLRLLLERNLFGVDIDPHAVRVASFSLYLAMCDEIDPKHYWTQVRFPRMRGSSLVCSDFFSEETAGIRSETDAAAFDIVVGNAPWGRNSVGTSDISHWTKAGWPSVYNSIGPLFLAKAVVLLKHGGLLSMLQPAGLILNDVGTAQAFREKLFETVAIESIVNLAALRFVLFPNAIGPACILTLRNEPPEDDDIVYICPKPVAITEDDYRIVVEPYDVHTVPRSEAFKDSVWWTALMWGARRDVALIGKLNEMPTLKKAADGLKTREGIIRGNRRRSVKRIGGRRFLEKSTFPRGTWLRLKARDLPINHDLRTHSADSTDFAAFELPQLLIKQSWTIEKGRFEAALIESDVRTGAALCTQSYITVHVPHGNEHVLEAACLTCNSILAVYFLFLTSARLAAYRPEPLVSDWLSLPIPRASEELLDGLTNPNELDLRVFERLSLTGAERALIEDTVKVTLADFKGDASSPGRRSTRSPDGWDDQQSEPVLTRFCHQFVKVIQAAFGRDKGVRATIFQESAADLLPVRMVAFHLNWSGNDAVGIETLDGSELWNRLRAVAEQLTGACSRTGFQRMARIYDSVTLDARVLPTVYLIKPDAVRYWTRSAALRDADDVCADFLLWSDAQPPVGEPELRLA